MVGHNTLYCGWYSTFILYLALVDCHSVTTLIKSRYAFSFLLFHTLHVFLSVQYRTCMCIYIYIHPGKKFGEKNARGPLIDGDSRDPSNFSPIARFGVDVILA